MSIEPVGLYAEKRRSHLDVAETILLIRAISWIASRGGPDTAGVESV
jgi:hypothetical protein